MGRFLSAPYGGMAPKPGNQQQQLLQLLAGLVKQQSRAGANQATWSCDYCTEGDSNWAHRQTCFKCHRDRRTGVLVTPSGHKAQPAKSAKPQVRAKSAAPALKTAAQTGPPKPPAGEAEEDQEDPVAQELEDARAYHSWVKQQKPRVKDKELPAAEERLAKAETADKQRKPPGERLQSALSRVAYRQRLATAAQEAEQAAQEAYQTAQKEAETAQQKLSEAQQELAVAQQAHKVWGREPGAETQPGTGLGAEVTADQKQALEELSTKYVGTEVGNLLLRAFPKTLLQPEVAKEVPPRAASEGNKPKGTAERDKRLGAGARSRSPKDKATDASKRQKGDQTQSAEEKGMNVDAGV